MSCPHCHQPRPNPVHTSSSQFTEIKPSRSANVVVQHAKHGNGQLADNRPLDNRKVSPTFFGNPKEEVAYICRETRRVDEMISRLNEERAALQRRLNHIQSLTGALSPEILAVIFKHLCFHQSLDFPGRGKDKFPQLVLGAVCSLWRQVARSTPILWTSATFEFHAPNVREEAALLRLFLENSGNLPLTLKFGSRDLLSHDPNLNYLVHSTVDELVIMNLPRIQELRLSSPSKKWLYSTYHLSQLTKFSLEEFTGDFSLSGHGLRFPNSPLLHQLHLCSVLEKRKGASLPLNIDLPFAHTITDLYLSGVPANICVELLTRCPKLIECTIWSFHGWSAGVELPKIMLPHLEDLSLDATTHPGDKSILPYIHTPSLRSLYLTANDPASTQTFFTRLPPTLSVLELHWYDHTLQELVRKDSGLETLVLIDCDPEIVLDFLFELRSYDQPDDKPLPRLKTLILRMDNEAWEPASRYMHHEASLDIMHMLHKRMNDPKTDQFYLLLESIRVKWLHRAKRGLKKLVDRGFKIEISQRKNDDSDLETLDLS